MNNINDIITELDMMLASENKRNAMADEAISKAEALRAKAVLEKEEAALNQARIAEAMKKVNEAKSVLDELDNETSEEEYEEVKEENNNYAGVYATPAAGATDVNNTVDTKNNKKCRCGIAFISGVLVTSLLATGAWVLCKEAKKGNVRFPRFVSASVDNNCHDHSNCNGKDYYKDGVSIPKQVAAANDKACYQDDKSDIYDAGDCTKYIYNYDQNVVTITTGVDAEDARVGVEPSQELFTTTDTTSQFVSVDGTERVIVNPVQEPEIDINGKYVELTTERFEDLTTALIKKYEDMGLQISREKLIKYVMIRNIDKLKQDNPELVKSIIGTQTVEKVYTDFEDVISAITTWNWLDFDRYHDVNRLLSAADGVFDETQKAKVIEIEKRVHEIGRNYQNEEVYNDLAYSLIRDMINPLTPIYGLEDDVSLGVQWIDTYLVRARFGTDRYIKLHVQVEELMKQFIPFAGDEQKYFENAVATGNMAAVKILLNDCLLESSKILTK